MRDLEHPSLLKLFRVYESKHSIYFVTDYMEGGDLFEKLNFSDKIGLKDAK
jgi:serine/threonine protein kinase